MFTSVGSIVGKIKRRLINTTVQKGRITKEKNNKGGHGDGVTILYSLDILYSHKTDVDVGDVAPSRLVFDVDLGRSTVKTFILK